VLIFGALEALLAEGAGGGEALEEAGCAATFKGVALALDVTGRAGVEETEEVIKL
jgi:hypothetical protein